MIGVLDDLDRTNIQLEAIIDKLIFIMHYLLKLDCINMFWLVSRARVIFAFFESERAVAKYQQAIHLLVLPLALAFFISELVGVLVLALLLKEEMLLNCEVVFSSEMMFQFSALIV